MNTRPKVRAETDAKIKELSTEISKARERAEDLKRAAQVAKTEYKKTRRAFKLAKKLAKEARKKVKELKKTLHAAARAAAQPPPSKKAPARSRRKNSGPKNPPASGVGKSKTAPEISAARFPANETPTLALPPRSSDSSAKQWPTSAETIKMPIEPSVNEPVDPPEPA